LYGSLMASLLQMRTLLPSMKGKVLAFWSFPGAGAFNPLLPSPVVITECPLLDGYALMDLPIDGGPPFFSKEFQHMFNFLFDSFPCYLGRFPPFYVLKRLCALVFPSVSLCFSDLMLFLSSSFRRIRLPPPFVFVSSPFGGPHEWREGEEVHGSFLVR